MSRIDEIRARINEGLPLYPNGAEVMLAEIDQLTADKANLLIENNRFVETTANLTARNDRLVEALIAATANLSGAASAYRSHASRHKSVLPKSKPDPFYSTRIMDFERAEGEARRALESNK